ncbi:MAG: VOC family protein [Jannaschia sp.]
MTSTPHAIIWAEIPVRNLSKGRTFYESVLQVDMPVETMGPNETAVFPHTEAGGVSGHLYEGKPAGDGRGPSVSLVVRDALPDVMARVRAAGGTVLSEAITIPAGQFFYANDPDGNSISFFRV